MPLFEYECKECKKTFELLVKNVNEKVSCPECGSKSVEKMMGHFAPLGFSSHNRLNMGCAEDTGYKCALKDSGGCCGCGM